MNEQLAQFQQQLLKDVDAGFSHALSQLPEQAPRLKEAMSYVLLNSGKRVRPQITMLVGQMLGANEKDLLICSLAVESIHTFSLVHDDLPAMDDDDLRRGKPTCHIAFDEATAVLTGDALQALAFELISDNQMTEKANHHRIEMIRTLAHATGYLGLCGGQSIDIVATGKHITRPELEQLHHLKTGALIQAAVTLAYYCADVQDTHCIEKLNLYATNLGLAFQVIDDILDVTSDTETLGKPQGSDVQLGKSTYPVLLGLDGAKGFAEELTQNALQALEDLPYNTDLLTQFTHYILSRKY